MKKVLCVGSVASLVLVASSVSAEVVNDSFQFKGESASAQWFSGDDCSYSNAYIWGGEQVSHTSSGQPTYAAGAQAYVQTYNWCTNEYVEGWGWTDGGVSVNSLTSATIEVPVTVFHWSCFMDDWGGYYCEQVVDGSGTFTASLTGFGDTYSGRTSSMWHGGTTHVNDRATGKYRQATVTGSFVVGGTELAIGDTFGDISNVNAGSHFVTRY